MVAPREGIPALMVGRGWLEPSEKAVPKSCHHLCNVPLWFKETAPQVFNQCCLFQQPNYLTTLPASVISQSVEAKCEMGPRQDRFEAVLPVLSGSTAQSHKGFIPGSKWGTYLTANTLSLTSSAFSPQHS